VQGLLLEAHPEANNINLVTAARVAEATGKPRNHRQMETFAAIRDLRTAIEGGAAADEAESLLLYAIKVAENWALSEAT
jgi:hypothetical protein